MPGSSECLRHLPCLDADVVRFGFAGAHLTLADGHPGWAAAQQGQGSEEALRGRGEGVMLMIPLRRSSLLVQGWRDPHPGPGVALQSHAKNS